MRQFWTLAQFISSLVPLAPPPKSFPSSRN